MISNFNEEAEEILIKAKLEMLELKHPYVGTEHLMLAILHTKNDLSEKLENYNLTYTKFKNEIIKIIGKGSKKSEFFLHTPILKKVIENAIIDSKDNNNGIVTTNHLLTSLLDIGEGIAIRILMNMNVDIDEMYNDITLKSYNESSNKRQKLLIEEIGIDINQKAKNNEIDPIIGRNEELKKIEAILCRRNKNNPLLIGEPGVGKTALVEALAVLIENEEVPCSLANKRIISLDMASAVAGTKYRGEFEERMKKIIEEIEENNNIILFIDEIHTLIGAGGAEGAIDASNILKPALARGRIRCIGATTNEEYKKHFEKDKALERRFQKIIIEEPTIEQTKEILTKLKPIYENFHNVKIDSKVIDSIISLTEKYFYTRFRPDKQIDILDEVCSKVSIDENKNHTEMQYNLKEIRNKKELYKKENNIQKMYEYKIKETNIKRDMSNINKQKEVSIRDVANVISSKTGIPIYEILKAHKKTFKELESKLKETIIGQDDAINKLLSVTKKIKLGFKESECIAILFTGPTGVGKTTLAKLYSKLLNQKTININMNEFSDSSSVSKFIGTSAGYIGYEDNNYTLSIIKDNPNATIILNNIENAHPKIINILNQILKENRTKDAKNNVIHFNNNTLLLISNSKENIEKIGFNHKLATYKEETNEIYQNINTIITFKNLNAECINKIISKKISELKEKYKEIHITIEENIIKEIINESNYKEYGAKKINHIIQNKIESEIINSIIENKKEININTIFSK